MQRYSLYFADLQRLCDGDCLPSFAVITSVIRLIGRNSHVIPYVLLTSIVEALEVMTPQSGFRQCLVYGSLECELQSAAPCVTDPGCRTRQLRFRSIMLNMFEIQWVCRTFLVMESFVSSPSTN
jgi:hypothetical protein